jgi:hypothetical protein
MVKLPKPSDWESEDKKELLDASTKGWNMLMRLPVLLRKYYDWAKPLTFGFFSEADVNEARSLGWEHVQTAFLDEAFEDYNKLVATPFGLIDFGGVVKARDNFLMMMSTDFREEQMKRRHEKYLNDTEDSLRHQAYAHPSDPKYAEMLEAAQEVSRGESYKVRQAPTEDDDQEGLRLREKE